MNFCYFFSILVFISHADGINLSANSTVISNKTTTKIHELNNNYNGKNDTNITKVEMLSEGGSIVTKNRLPAVLKDNHTNLLTLDNEIGKTKEKSIVARKGVEYNAVENTADNIDHKKERIDTTLPKTKIEKSESTVNTSQIIEGNQIVNVTTNHKQGTVANGSLITNTSSTTSPKIPKKPLVVSYEALGEINQKVESEHVMSKIETSSKTVVLDQLPTPNVKVQPMSSSRHPGMIMPIVITILVVPMFAVLGYMALRRGREAWKNRHYKRMDFLLDGMYND
jgi:hypothetical protein